jgi:hypothetical protein
LGSSETISFAVCSYCMKPRSTRRSAGTSRSRPG